MGSLPFRFHGQDPQLVAVVTSHSILLPATGNTSAEIEASASLLLRAICVRGKIARKRRKAVHSSLFSN